MASIVLHGGAGRIAEADREAYVRGLTAARDLGFAALERGESALAAVTQAVTSMEDNAEAFNAGLGSSLNRDGEVECDAAVMAGWDQTAGAVGAVMRIKNPVLAADRVRTESPHVLIVGAGAEAFGPELVENGALVAPRQLERWQRWRERNEGPAGSATVGAVALDRAGRLAAATSTGGVTGKAPGRLGDSPLIGAGTWADASVALSCTGHGESFIRGVSARQLAWLLESGWSLSDATARVLEEVRGFGGDGGLIAVTAEGRLCAAYNAPSMAYAWRRESGGDARVGLEPGVHVL
jgi:beta-aspartyl-peptidase (threonine type)